MTVVSDSPNTSDCEVTVCRPGRYRVEKISSPPLQELAVQPVACYTDWAIMASISSNSNTSSSSTVAGNRRGSNIDAALDFYGYIVLGISAATM
jgi:hypothetical protein